tara:strand:- start:113 stop:448 length:336 start_codon:yes stop_codon:yes gene_type:complete
MKNKIIIFIGLIFGAHCINLFMKTDIRAPEIKTYEIKDENTGKIYLLRKIPKLKKSVVYCHKHKQNVVVWVDWHIHQTPEYTYRFDTYDNYINKTWVERHYGYKINNDKKD